MLNKRDFQTKEWEGPGWGSRAGLCRTLRRARAALTPRSLLPGTGTRALPLPITLFPTPRQVLSLLLVTAHSLFRSSHTEIIPGTAQTKQNLRKYPATQPRQERIRPKLREGRKKQPVHKIVRCNFFLFLLKSRAVRGAASSTLLLPTDISACMLVPGAVLHRYFTRTQHRDYSMSETGPEKNSARKYCLNQQHSNSW